MYILQGASALHILSASYVTETAHLVRMLVRARIDVNVQVEPQMQQRRAIMQVARCAVKCGTDRNILDEFAFRKGATPLMHASRYGDVLCMRG